MENIKYFNIAAESWGVLFCLVAVAFLLFGTKMERKTRNYLLAIFLCLALDLLSNITAILSKGKLEMPGPVIVRVANFSEFFFGYVLTFLFTQYLLHILRGETGKELRGWYLAAGGILAAAVSALILSQFNGMFYHIDDASMYRRGPLFWLSQAIAIGSLVLDIALIIRYRRSLTKKELIPFVVYVTLPIGAMLIQLFFYGIYWLLLATTIAAITLLTCIMSDQLDKYCQKEREIADMRLAIILSQIQPHFLHNSLTAIAQLCEDNPQKAKEITIQFSEYLRQNMNALVQKAPISFEKELEHVKTYLSIEQVRFGDYLHVTYDIGATDFLIPPLCVQPIVENAVKHGVGMKEDGGTVVIRTRELPDGYTITVSDDGVGFDPDRMPSDGKAHIGIQNARDRLDKLFGAALSVESGVGRGTTVTIHIPKKEAGK